MWTVLFVLIAIAATLAVRDVPVARRRVLTSLFARISRSTSPNVDLLPGTRATGLTWTIAARN